MLFQQINGFFRALWLEGRFYISPIERCLQNTLGHLMNIDWIFGRTELSFVSPILPEWPASRKTELQKNYLSSFGALSALRNTRVFSRFALRQEVNSVDFRCTDWLSYRRTQLKAFVEEVCSRSRIFFSAVFSDKIFARSTHLKDF